MKVLNKKSKVILIPDTLKDSRVKVKFCYFALRNLIYYTDKGLRTQMKSNKEFHDCTIKTLIDNYLDCAHANSKLSEEESNLIRNCFLEKNKSIIPKNDYFLAVEKELTFKNFAFYCNSLVELSFHIGEKYFNNEYIFSTIEELSTKMMVKINDTFIDFIILDVNTILNLIDNV